jgi:hypothetical protein
VRALTVILQQNLGTGSTTTPATRDISAHLIDVGSINYEVDKELTKLTPGDVTLQVEDHDGAIWLWINTQIQMAGALWPPIVTLDVGGVRRFCGNIDPSAMTCDARTRQITLTCQDWSNQLANKNIEGWTRPLPKILESRAASTAIANDAEHTRNVISNYPYNRKMVVFLHDAIPCVVGDLLNCVTPFGTFLESKITQTYIDHLHDGVHYDHYWVSDIIWREASLAVPVTEWQGSFTRTVSATTVQNFFMVTKAVVDDWDKLSTAQQALQGDSGGYLIVLDTVDGIVAGDRLELLGTSSVRTWTVSAVATGTNTLTVAEEVGVLALNDRIYWTAECAAEVVMADAVLSLKTAALPFDCNVDRLVMPTFSEALYSIIGLTGSPGGTVSAINNAQATLTDIAIFSSTYPAVVGWHGSPEGGWVATSAYTDGFGTWTNQVDSPPSSLMNVRTLNQVYTTRFNWNLADYVSGRAITFLGLDILQTTPPSEVYITPWTGTAWGTQTMVAWMHGLVRNACIFPGHAGAVLAVTGGKYGTVQTLWYAELPTGASASYVLPSRIREDLPEWSVYVFSTPWGAYLVGSKGYGAITYAAGELSVNWIAAFPANSFLQPTTFCHLDETRLFVVLSQLDGTTYKTINTNGYLLDAAPDAADAPGAIIWSDRLCPGDPTGNSWGCFHDPFFPGGRVFGWLAGAMFQVAAGLSVGYAIERFNPSKFTAMELIEHICQVLRAVAVATPDNVLHIISRSDTLDIIELVVDRVEVVETRAWENFFSTVLVTGEDDSTGEAAGPNVGGQLLEITGHPLIWTSSMCSAMASSYADWFGIPRRVSAETWFWSHPETAAPWEGLPPLARVRVNGGTTAYILMGVQDLGHAREGSAQVILLEVV